MPALSRAPSRAPSSADRSVPDRYDPVPRSAQGSPDRRAGNAAAQERLSLRSGVNPPSDTRSRSADPGYRPSASDVVRSVGVGAGEGGVGAGEGGAGDGEGGAGAGGDRSWIAVASVTPRELCAACGGLSQVEAAGLLARPGAAVRSVAFGGRIGEVGAWIALVEVAGAHLSAAPGADARAGAGEIAAALAGLSDPERMSALEMDALIRLARADDTLSAARQAVGALFGEGAAATQALSRLRERAQVTAGATAASTLYSRLRPAGVTPEEVDAAVGAYRLSVLIELGQGEDREARIVPVQTPYHISSRRDTAASPTAMAAGRQGWIAEGQRDPALAAAVRQTAWAKGSAAQTQATLQAALDGDVDGCRALAGRVWAAEIAAGATEAEATAAVSAAISGWMGEHDVGVDCSGFTFTSTMSHDPEAAAAWQARNPGRSQDQIATNHSSVSLQISSANAVPVPACAVLSGDLAATASATHIGLVRDRTDRALSDALDLLPEDRRAAARAGALRTDGSLQDGSTVHCVQIAHTIDANGSEDPDDLPGPHIGLYVYNRRGAILWRDDPANGGFSRFFRQRVG